MAKLNIFFYRPDKIPNQNVVPELCYTLNGQPYAEWVDNQRTKREVEVEKLKKEIFKKPHKNPHFVEDYWR